MEAFIQTLGELEFDNSLTNLICKGFIKCATDIHVFEIINHCNELKSNTKFDNKNEVLMIVNDVIHEVFENCILQKEDDLQSLLEIDTERFSPKQMQMFKSKSLNNSRVYRKENFDIYMNKSVEDFSLNNPIEVEIDRQMKNIPENLSIESKDQIPESTGKNGNQNVISDREILPGVKLTESIIEEVNENSQTENIIRVEDIDENKMEKPVNCITNKNILDQKIPFTPEFSDSIIEKFNKMSENTTNLKKENENLNYISPTYINVVSLNENEEKSSKVRKFENLIKRNSVVQERTKSVDIYERRNTQAILQKLNDLTIKISESDVSHSYIDSPVSVSGSNKSKNSKEDKFEEITPSIFFTSVQEYEKDPFSIEKHLKSKYSTRNKEGVLCESTTFSEMHKTITTNESSQFLIDSGISFLDESININEGIDKIFEETKEDQSKKTTSTLFSKEITQYIANHSTQSDGKPLELMKEGLLMKKSKNILGNFLVISVKKEPLVCSYRK